MAVTKTIILDSGVVANNAYIKIANVSGDKSRLFFVLDVYLSADAYNNGKTPLTQKSYSFIPSQDESAARWDKQCYGYVKTLDEYADAIDC